MAEIKKWGCGCKSCQKEGEALQRQLDHPFYNRVDEFRDEIKEETLLKASKKYDEPFNPGSWTVRQLGKHAMAENYDQGNYIVGLMEKAEGLEKLAFELGKEIDLFRERNEVLLKELNHYKNRCKDYERKLNDQQRKFDFVIQQAEARGRTIVKLGGVIID